MALAEFDPLRKRLQGQFSQRRSEADEALKRRFASSGMLNSGAYEKNVQQQQDQFARQEADALAEVEFAEAQEARRRTERDEDKAFAREQTKEGMQFQKTEREASQLFNKQLFDSDMAFKQMVFGAEQEWKRIEDNWRGKEFDQNIRTNMIQAWMGMDPDWDDPSDMDDFINRMNEFGVDPKYLPRNMQGGVSQSRPASSAPRGNKSMDAFYRRGGGKMGGKQ